mgnify:CR=1 FL=1
MAKQKITVESRLRTENTMLKEQLRAAQAAHADIARTATEATKSLHQSREEHARTREQLSEVRRQLDLSQERSRSLHVTSLTLSRLVGEGIAQSEDLRYPPASRADNQKSTR